MARYQSVVDAVGNTPLIRLAHMAPPDVNVYVKAESFNPMGSVKDRLARAIIEDAERSGALRPGQTVIEATSGNTGIGLAMVCARKGYPLVVTMAENFSIERRKLLRFLGAKVVLTPAADKGTGMLNKAVELAETHGYFLCRQFENPANAEVHRTTTAREILADMKGDPVDFFVSGFGTGGTLAGVSRGLKSASPATVVVAAEPDNSPVLAGGNPQPTDQHGNPSASHPDFRPHLMQGWAPDFVSSITRDAVDAGLVDMIAPVGGETAMRCARELAQTEGLLVGTSSGATLAAALELARNVPRGSNIVCMLPDTGERYLSTPLFADIDAEMSTLESAISRSTPGYRFDAVAEVHPIAAARKAPALIAADDPELEPAAEALVEAVVAENPVVMFALEWCEFCWSVRKFLERLEVDYESQDLDSVPFQIDEKGTRVREVLKARTGAATIPQIYIGGVHIGGATELFDAYKDGSLASALDAAGVSWNREADVDPYTLLPGWLHRRTGS